MIFLIFSFIYSFLDNFTMYRGSLISEETQNFYFNYYFVTSYCKNCSFLDIKLKFSNESQYYSIDKTLYGIYQNSTSSFFYFGFSNNNKNAKEYFQLINHFVTNLNMTQYYQNHQIDFIFQNIIPIQYFLWFNISNDSPEIIKEGIISIINTSNFTFTAKKLDENLYYSETKKVTLLAFYFLILSTIQYVYIYIKTKSTDDFNQYSCLSLIIQFSFDYGFIIFLSDVINESKIIYDKLKLIYFLFNFLNFIKLIFASFLLSIICINKNLNEFSFFLYQVILLFFSIFCFALFGIISKYIRFIMIILYSYFIPQIIHSLIFGRKPKIQLFYLSLFRLCVIFYITYRKTNLIFMNLYSPLFFLYILIYVLIQFIIIFVQNKFGGNLILLRIKYNNPFDYKKKENIECSICYEVINRNDDIMVTPCFHCFHRRCLEKWMNIKLICPLCRKDISVLAN